MGKHISILGFDRAKAQLLLHFYLNHYGQLGKYQSKFNCPHCKVSSILDSSNIAFNYYFNQDDHRFFLSCIISCLNSKCRKETLIAEQFEVVDTDITSLYELIKRSGFMDLIDQDSLDIEVLYPRGDYITYISYGDDSHLIPKSILADFIEIQRVSFVSPRASLVLSRRLLEKLLLDKYPGLSSENNLFKMIEKVPDNSLSKDMMDDIRIIGNNTIHVSNPDSDFVLTNDDSALAIHVIDDLLHEFYITPGKKENRRKKLTELRKLTDGNHS